MSAEELRGEIEAGVRFYGWFSDDSLVGVMWIQAVKDTTLIRHSYVCTKYQGRSIGSMLLQCLIGLAETAEILVGTWKDAFWAICFYKHHGFTLVPFKEKDRFLQEYWQIPERQIETSIVLRFISKRLIK